MSSMWRYAGFLPVLLATAPLSSAQYAAPTTYTAAPGYTATDLNAHRGGRTVQQAAEIIVRLATLEPGGPTGGYFDENGALPW